MIPKLGKSFTCTSTSSPAFSSSLWLSIVCGQFHRYATLPCRRGALVHSRRSAHSSFSNDAVPATGRMHDYWPRWIYTGMCHRRSQHQSFEVEWCNHNRPTLWNQLPTYVGSTFYHHLADKMSSSAGLLCNLWLHPTARAFDDLFFVSSAPPIRRCSTLDCSSPRLPGQRGCWRFSVRISSTIHSKCRCLAFAPSPAAIC